MSEIWALSIGKPNRYGILQESDDEKIQPLDFQKCCG
jgi:hypothetical protein